MLGTSPRAGVRIAVSVAAIFLALAAILAGLHIRRRAWDFSQGLHYHFDANNAFSWGRFADNVGLFHTYDEDANLEMSGGTPQTRALRRPGLMLDYTPLRLTAAWLWYRWVHVHYPSAVRWSDDYAQTSPMLWANTTAEFSSAIFVFLLIRLWRKRSHPSVPNETSWKRWLHIEFPAAIGSLLIWFNPAVIWVSHCWPQWDIWDIPFFLAAALLASLDGWFTAGLLLAIGASLKGQLLLAAPVLILWPIFRAKFDSALRIAAGLALGSASIALPWMLPSRAAILWLIVIGMVLIWFSPGCRTLRPRDWRIDLAIAAMAMLIAWPWMATSGTLPFQLSVLLVIALAASLRWVPNRYQWPTILLLAAIAVFLPMKIFGASSNWYDLGLVYGANKFAARVGGNGVYNLPRMMSAYLKWPMRSADPVSLPFVSTTITFSTLSRIAYGIGLILCGLGAAMQDRRRDSRFLVALVAPWLLFFLLLTEMHERYGMFAAAVGAVLAGTSVGMTLLGILLTLVAWMGIVENQLRAAQNWSPATLELLRNLDPGPGFLLLLIAAIFLYVILTPSRSRLTNTPRHE